MYVTFGDQRVNGEGGEKCTLKESQISHKSISEGHAMDVGFGCQMTMIAQLYTKIQLSLPAFTICYFMLSWVFIFAFGIFLAYHGHYKKTGLANTLAGYSQLSGNDFEEQDEDLQLFMKGAQREDNPGLAQSERDDLAMELFLPELCLRPLLGFPQSPRRSHTLMKPSMSDVKSIVLSVEAR